MLKQACMAMRGSLVATIRVPYRLLREDQVLSHSTENSRDMVESWNLAWTELWYFIRALQRRRKSEQLDVLGSFGF